MYEQALMRFENHCNWLDANVQIFFENILIELKWIEFFFHCECKRKEERETCAFSAVQMYTLRPVRTSKYWYTLNFSVCVCVYVCGVFIFFFYFDSKHLYLNVIRFIGIVFTFWCFSLLLLYSGMKLELLWFCVFNVWVYLMSQSPWFNTKRLPLGTSISRKVDDDENRKEKNTRQKNGIMWRK